MQPEDAGDVNIYDDIQKDKEIVKKINELKFEDGMIIHFECVTLQVGDLMLGTKIIRTPIFGTFNIDEYKFIQEELLSYHLTINALKIMRFLQFNNPKELKKNRYFFTNYRVIQTNNDICWLKDEECVKPIKDLDDRLLTYKRQVTFDYLVYNKPTERIINLIFEYNSKQDKSIDQLSYDFFDKVNTILVKKNLTKRYCNFKFGKVSVIEVK